MNKALPAQDPALRLAELEREVAKLRKINKVLIDRVERSMDSQGNAYSLFQTAIVLEGRVRDRTTDLQNTLQMFAKVNRELSAANDEAQKARRLLHEAVESINEGFVLYDSDDRLVMCNDKYREFWPGIEDIAVPGITFAALLHHATALGLIDEDSPSISDLSARRVDYHRKPVGFFVVKLATGRWLQISERRTADGGLVAIHSDITAIKLAEQQQREQELAAKSALLQTIFDNISQGISLVDRNGRLQAWNERFLDILDLPPDAVWVGRDILELPPEAVWVGRSLREFSQHADMAGQLSHFPGDAVPDDFESFSVEHICANGQVLEIRVGPMPDGGIVTTYSDITERKRSEWALRDSEQRIRLITDTVPAMIAYVDATETYRFANKPYQQWFKRRHCEIDGRSLRNVLGESAYRERLPYVRSALAGQRVTFEFQSRPPRGGTRHGIANYVPHFASSGEVLGFFTLIQDITQLREAADLIRETNENLERRVEERTLELRELNGKLSAEIEEHIRTQQALSDAKAEAENANISKTRFLAAASHDLLQPLNAARVFTAALGEARLGDANRRLVGNISDALGSVDDLLSALLDISKFDAGAYTPLISNFCVNDILAALVTEHQPQAEARGLSLRAISTPAVLRSDPVLVSRILRNFLSNALRYTPRGRILLGCRRRRDGVEIQVWDSGIGIPVDKQEEIFQEFHRLSTDSSGRDHGMGLGLAIVERIARCLEITVTLRSVPGKGSMFGILVPFGDALPVRAIESPPAHPAESDQLAHRKVLVIENDHAEREAMQALLEAWRCRVVTVPDAAGARAAVETLGRPDVVIADYHLDHGRTGIEAVRSVQSLYAEAAPVVVITADRSDAVLSEIRAESAHLLNKPVKPARLRSLLTHLAGGARLLA